MTTSRRPAGSGGTVPRFRVSGPLDWVVLACSGLFLLGLHLDGRDGGRWDWLKWAAFAGVLAGSAVVLRRLHAGPPSPAVRRWLAGIARPTRAGMVLAATVALAFGGLVVATWIGPAGEWIAAAGALAFVPAFAVAMVQAARRARSLAELLRGEGEPVDPGSARSR